MTGENLWIKAFWDSAGNYLRKHSTGNDLKKHICCEIGRHTLHGMIFFPTTLTIFQVPNRRSFFFIYLLYTFKLILTVYDIHKTSCVNYWRTCAFQSSLIEADTFSRLLFLQF